MNLLNRLMGCVLISAISSCGGNPAPGAFPEIGGRAPIAGTNAAIGYVPSVLFIGNSLIGTQTAATHEDMPAVLSRLASARGETLIVQRALNSGYTLQQTWNAGTPQPFLSVPGQWDFVALADLYPFSTRAEYVAALDRNYDSLSHQLSTPNLIAPLSKAFGCVRRRGRWRR